MRQSTYRADDIVGPMPAVRACGVLVAGLWIAAAVAVRYSAAVHARVGTPEGWYGLLLVLLAPAAPAALWDARRARRRSPGDWRRPAYLVLLGGAAACVSAAGGLFLRGASWAVPGLVGGALLLPMLVLHWRLERDLRRSAGRDA